MTSAAGKQTAKTGFDRTTAIHVLLIMIAVCAAYVNTLHYGFVTDDFGLFVDNHNTKSWGRLVRIFTTGYWDTEGATGGLYRPLAILSFLVEYKLFGLDSFWYHLDNVVLHFACTVLAYLLMRRVFEGPKAPLFAALLFAAHPVHTEAVTWVSGRAELLWAFFGLSSMLVFLRYGDRVQGVAVSCALFLLGLLCKESVVVVPVMLAAYLLLYEKPEPGAGRFKQLVGRLWPYLAVFAVYLPARLYVLGSFGPSGGEQVLAGLGPYERFLTMCRALFEYVRLGFFPAELKAAYMFPPPGSVADPRVIAGIAAVVVIAVFAGRLIRLSRPSYLGAVWFLAALLPVSNIVPTGVIMSERAMYVPVLGVCMIFGAALTALDGYLMRGNKSVVPAGTILMTAVLGLFIAGSVTRNPVWTSHEAFGRAYMELMDEYRNAYPDDERIITHAANIRLRFFGYEPETAKAIDEAYRMYGDDDPRVMYMRAFAFLKGGRPEDALREVTALMERFPPSDREYHLAANVLAELKRYDEALRMADKAIGANPNKDSYRMLKGNILMETGNDGAALAVFEEAAVMNPENYDAFLMQGIILDSQGRFGPAIEKVRRAVAIKPDMADLRYFLAVAYLDAGMPAEAVPELEAAVRLKPGYREAEELLTDLRNGMPR